MVAFLQYLQKFFDPIRDLAEKFNIIQSAMASSERIFELLDTDFKKQNSISYLIKDKELRGQIEFRNVWFKYKEKNYVLKDVSFNLNKGESLAILGATGSGKTSIINTLCAFYDARISPSPNDSLLHQTHIPTIIHNMQAKIYHGKN